MIYVIIVASLTVGKQQWQMSQLGMELLEISDAVFVLKKRGKGKERKNERKIKKRPEYGISLCASGQGDAKFQK